MAGSAVLEGRSARNPTSRERQELLGYALRANPTYDYDADRRTPVNEDKFNMSLRKFLKQVGVTSQREIERVVREKGLDKGKLKVRMVLTAAGTSLNHVVEQDLDLG